MIRVPEFYTDADGRKLARVPLAHRSECAVLDYEDFGELLERGYSTQWHFNHNGKPHMRYVRCGGDEVRLTAVARLILGAGPRTHISYKDGDRLNLRRENLVLRKGGKAKRDCSPLVSEGDE